MTLTKFVGLSSFNVSAGAMAAIVDIVSPVPIIVTHPTMAGALDMNGNTDITITGGPQRSIQVNSNGRNPAGAAYNPPSSGNVDLSTAGPHGTGGDFGTFGGPTSNPGHTLLGTTGHYLNSSPVQDPLAGVPEPTTPACRQADSAIVQWRGIALTVPLQDSWGQSRPIRRIQAGHILIPRFNWR